MGKRTDLKFHADYLKFLSTFEIWNFYQDSELAAIIEFVLSIEPELANCFHLQVS